MAAGVTFHVSEVLCSFPISLQASASQLAAWAQGYHRVATGTSKEGLVDPRALFGLQVIRGTSSYCLCSRGRCSYKAPVLWLAGWVLSVQQWPEACTWHAFICKSRNSKALCAGRP